MEMMIKVLLFLSTVAAVFGQESEFVENGWKVDLSFFNN